MTHLYRALSWTVDEPERPREYVIHDDGVILAKVNRVAVARPDDAAMPYANPHASYDETRIVVCATAPDGTPYFYVDRTPGTTGPTPAFIVAPNGGLIGAIAVRRVGLKGMFRLLSGQAGGGLLLQDASGKPVATAAGRARNDPQGAIADANGAPLAWYSTEVSPLHHVPPRRRHTMRIDHIPPEPTHTLLLAFLIGLEALIPRA